MRKYSLQTGMHRIRNIELTENNKGGFTREIISTRSPAEVNPYSASSAGEDKLK